MVLQTWRKAWICRNQILYHRVFEILHLESFKIFCLRKDSDVNSRFILALRIFLSGAESLDRQGLKFAPFDITVRVDAKHPTSHAGPGFRLFLDVESDCVGVDFGLISALAKNGDFERLGWWKSLDAGNAYSIPPFGRDFHCGQVGDGVRVVVVASLDLVDELRAHSVDADDSIIVGLFGDDCVAVLVDLSEGECQIVVIGNSLKPRKKPASLELVRSWEETYDIRPTFNK